MRTSDDLLLEKAYEKVTKKCNCEVFEEFIEKRKAGAEKIARAAETKGGYSILTAYHFQAKAKPYADVYKHQGQEESSSYYKEKAMEALDKLKKLDNLSQKEFQAITGVLEVYGEAYIQNKTNKDYSK